MLLITKQELIKMKPCKGGRARFINQTNNTDKPVEVVSLVGGLNTVSDLVWLASKKLPKERLVRFACDCALINVELIKPYTDEYDLIVGFLKNPSTTVRADRAELAATTAAAVRSDNNYTDTAAKWAARSTIAAATTANYITATNYSRAADQAARVSPEKVNDLLRELFS